MTDHISLLKANYCRAVLNTAAHSPDDDARRLLKGLATERATENTTEHVSRAEESALEAIRVFSSKLERGEAKPTGFDLSRTLTAVETWIRTAS
jgi:hypothetical protein